MTQFIRPEARAALWRWREVLAGGGLAGLGLWWMLGPGGLVGLVGGAITLAGIVLAGLGWQRGRFRGRRDGPGSVDVDEGQVTYFGPLTGGAIALADVTELALLRSGQTPHWRLSGDPAEPLHIPIDAAGSDDLFDAFAVLPGLNLQRLLAILDASDGGDVVVWQADARMQRDPLS